MAGDKKEDIGNNAELFDNWVRKHYVGNSRTKTITSEKYLKICKLIRGEDTSPNAKFKFWVRSKGFRLLRDEKHSDKVLDDPYGSLFVSLHSKTDNTSTDEGKMETFLRTNLPAISFFRKVAIVEEFYDIIKCSHVDENGVHSGQKKTYRVVSDTYAFLPREVITFYLLNCTFCKPRTQKYGSVNSKVKLNLLPQTINIQTTSVAIQTTSVAIQTTSVTNHDDEEKTSKVNKVIRPSPKIYRPTFVDDAAISEYHGNNKLSASQLMKDNTNTPIVTVIEGASSQQLKYEVNFNERNVAGGIKKQYCIEPDRSISPLRCKEQIVKNDYLSYTYCATSNVGKFRPKEISSFQDYRDHIKRRGVKKIEADGKKLDQHGCEATEIIPRSSSFRPIVKTRLDSAEKKTEICSYGSRMQPYMLPQGNRHLHNYKKQFIESNLIKRTASYNYLSENKSTNTYSYCTDTCCNLDSSTVWHKLRNTSNMPKLTNWENLNPGSSERP